MGEYKSALTRITKMIRGIGDPLVAVYTRAYLCRACLQLAPEYRDCLMENFNDFLLCLDQIKTPIVNKIAKNCSIEVPPYYQLFLPGNILFNLKPVTTLAGLRAKCISTNHLFSNLTRMP